ncbi:hypothetical protein ACSVDA_06240 [Cytobacillus sp. Hm23]
MNNIINVMRAHHKFKVEKMLQKLDEYSVYILERKVTSYAQTAFEKQHSK